MTASGALGATALASLPAWHIEVLLGWHRHRAPAGLETYGGSMVTAQDFTAAAQENHLPASEMPPASADGWHPVGELRALRRADPGADRPGDEAGRQAVGRQGPAHRQ